MAKKALLRLHNTQQHTITAIEDSFRRRQLWHRAEKSLTIQGKSSCRRLCDGDKKAGSDLFDELAALSPLKRDELRLNGKGDPKLRAAMNDVFPILIARGTLETARKAAESEYELLIQELPIVHWIENIPGTGVGSLAAIIGSTGNLWNYPTVQKLWARMGLAVMPDGRRQRNIAGTKTEKFGYSSHRRCVMWNIGTSILVTQTARMNKATGIIRPAGDYRLIFDARRAYEDAKNARGDYAPLAKLILQSSNFAKATEAAKAYKLGQLPKGHLKARAQRYMEKELLKRLWVEWRRVMGDAKP